MDDDTIKSRILELRNEIEALEKMLSPVDAPRYYNPTGWFEPPRVTVNFMPSEPINSETRMTIKGRKKPQFTML